MEVTFACPNPACLRPLKATAEHAGRYVRCPGCGRVLQLPAALPPEAQPAPAAIPVPPDAGVAAPAAVRLCPNCRAEMANPALCLACGFGLELPAEPAPARAVGPGPAPQAEAEVVEASPYELREDGTAGPQGPHPRRPDEGGAAPPGRKGDKRKQFARTYLGLGFHYAKVVGTLLNILLGIVAFLLVLGTKGRLAGALQGLEQVAGLLIALVGVTGSVLCCWVPPRSRARPLILASLAFDGAATLLRFLAAALAALAVSAAASGLEVCASLGSFVGLVLFLFFLRRLADYLDEGGLADEAMSIILFLGVVLVSIFLGALLLGGIVAAIRIPVVTLLLSFLAVVALLVVMINLLFRILYLLGSVRRALEARGPRATDSPWSEVPGWVWAAVLPVAFVLLAGMTGLLVFAGRGGAPAAAPAQQAAAWPPVGQRAQQPGPPNPPAVPRPGPAKPPNPPPWTPPKVPPPATDLPGLLGYWALDEGEGARAADSSGRGHHATLINARWADGIKGRALRCTGKDSYLDYGDSPGFSFAAGAPFTLAFWAQTTEDGGTLLSQRNQRNGSPVIDITFGGGRVKAEVRQDGNEFLGPVSVVGGAVNDGRWHHVALTRSGDAVELFLDGASQGQATGDSSRGPITTDWRTLGSERFHIKSGYLLNKPHFTGCLDEFCIFGRVLRPEEIAKLAGR